LLCHGLRGSIYTRVGIALAPRQGRSATRANGRLGAVGLALDLLDGLAASQGVSLAELSTTVRMEDALVSPILDLLTDRGLVHRDPLDLYWLGPHTHYLGGQASARTALLYASAETLDHVASITGGHVALATRERLEIRQAAGRGFSELLRLRPFIDSRGSLYSGGAAKLLLAYAPQEVIDAVIAEHLADFTPATIRTRDDVLRLLATIRRDGFYVSIGEYRPDVFTISAPVHDARGSVVAVLVILRGEDELNDESRQRLVNLVVSGANAISKRLGAHVRGPG
jgi:DNA-binding IclR family transcriptional regulator